MERHGLDPEAFEGRDFEALIIPATDVEMKPRVVDTQRLKAAVFFILSFLVGVAFTLFWTNEASKQIISVNTGVSSPAEADSIQRIHEVRSAIGSGLVQTAGAWGMSKPVDGPPGLEERNVSWEGPWVGTEPLMAPTKTGEVAELNSWYDAGAFVDPVHNSTFLKTSHIRIISG